MLNTVTLTNCPSGSHGDAFLTLNRRRGRITFSKAAIARMGLKSGNRVVFALTGEEMSVSVTDECDGFILHIVKSNTLGLFSSAAVRMIMSRCSATGQVVRIRIGGRIGDDWSLITKDAREVR